MIRKAAKGLRKLGARVVGLFPRKVHDPQVLPPVLQTVDFGSGMHAENFIFKQAGKYPNRTYAAVDPVLKAYSKNKRYANLFISWKHADEFLREMRELGLKTKHVNMDMPNPMVMLSILRAVFRNISFILVPNGKIFVTTEDHNGAKHIQEIARMYDLTTRKIVQLSAEEVDRRTHFSHLIHNHPLGKKPIYRVEITYPLRKAYPQKRDRQLLQGVHA